jgi:hypothetical protein
VAYANDFRRVYMESTPDQRITLAEFNEESCAAASKASIVACNLINKVMADYPQEAAGIKMEVKPVALDQPPVDRLAEDAYDIPRQKTAKGGWDVVAWVNLAKQKVASMDMVGIDKLCNVNSESILKLPTGARTIFMNAVGDRRRILSPTQPEDDEIPGYDETPMPDEDVQKGVPSIIPFGFNAGNPPKDQWETATHSILIDFHMAASLSDLQAVARNAAVKSRLAQIKAARPDLVDRLNQAYEAKTTTLKGPPRD